jgi:hypothetical protein
MVDVLLQTTSCVEDQGRGIFMSTDFKYFAIFGFAEYLVAPASALDLSVLDIITQL